MPCCAARSRIDFVSGDGGSGVYVLKSGAMYAGKIALPKTMSGAATATATIGQRDPSLRTSGPNGTPMMRMTTSVTSQLTIQSWNQVAGVSRLRPYLWSTVKPAYQSSGSKRIANPPHTFMRKTTVVRVLFFSSRSYHAYARADQPV